MNLVDVILVVVLVVSSLWGFKAGAVRAVGNIIGTVVSALLAWHFLEPTVQFLSPWIGSTLVRQVVFYFLLFAIISKLVGLIVYLLEKVFGLVSWLPFAEGANKLIGALVGAIEGIVLCFFGVLTAAYFSQYIIVHPATIEALHASRLATPIVQAAPILFFLLPKEIQFTRPIDTTSPEPENTSTETPTP